MNKTQRFYYTRATRPLFQPPRVEKKNYEPVIETATPDKEIIICEAYDMNIPAYTVEINSDGFWNFLNSNKWNEYCMIRVKPGFLNSDLTNILHDLLSDGQIFSYKTSGYIKITNKVDKFHTKKYGTVRLEFTYFARNESQKSELSRDSIRNKFFLPRLARKAYNKFRRIPAGFNPNAPSFHDKLKSLKLFNSNLKYFQYAEPIQLDYIFEKDECAYEKMEKIFKPSPRYKRPKTVREVQPDKMICPHMHIRSGNTLQRMPYLELIDSSKFSFEVIGRLINEEDKIRNAGCKIQWDKLYVTNENLDDRDSEEELEDEDSSESLSTLSDNSSDESVSKHNYFSDEWKVICKAIYGVIGSQEIFRNLKRHQSTIERPKSPESKESFTKPKLPKRSTLLTKYVTDTNETESCAPVFINNLYRSRIIHAKKNLTKLPTCQDKVLEALNNFVVRQEILCVSNSIEAFRTLVFIRPSFFNNVYL